MLNVLSKIFKPAQKINQKYYDYGPISFVEQLFMMGRQNISFYQCIRYYQQCAPLFSAIQLIADEVAAINPYLYDKNTSQFIKRNPLLDLLKNPNMDVTQSEFFEQIACYFLITGNCFIVATGDANKPAKELFIVPPQYVSLTPGDDGYIETININPGYVFTESFKRKEIDGRFRFYSSADREIWHIKEFNPLMGPNHLYGMPKMMPIFYEIEQYINASIHNLSLLRRGARPSGAIVSQEPFNDDQFMRMQEQMDKFYAGSNQAGRLLLLENGVDFREMSISNKDMDFMELKKNVTNTIFNTLKIPLPMVSPDHMTMANMDMAKLNLYDNAVLPLTQRIFVELSNFLLHRYTQDKNIEITFSDDEIMALQPRRNDDLVKIKSIGVLTINEIRKEMGYEPLQNGDALYGQATEVPIANDVYTADEPKEPAPMGKDYIRYTLRQQKDQYGAPKYSEAGIEEIVKHYDSIGYNSGDNF